MIRTLLLTSLILFLMVPGTVAHAEEPETKDEDKDTKDEIPPAELWGTTTVQTKPPRITLAELRTGKAFGLGLNIGSRTGLTMKIWPKRPHGITLDVGATNFTNSISFVIGYAFHAKPLRGPNGISAQFYLGAGFRTRLLIYTETDPDDDSRVVVRAAAVLGARVPFGITFLMTGFPVELFVEAAPAVDLWQSFGIDVEGIGGARVYF